MKLRVVSFRLNESVGKNKLVEEMEAAIATIFSFGSNEMKEMANKSIGSFLTQTQICSKPRNDAIGSAPNSDLLLIRT